MPVIRAECRGISPLIMGNKKLYKTPLPKDLSPEDEARMHLKRDSDDNIGIPSYALLLALERAGAYIQTRIAPELVRWAVEILEPFLLLQPCEWRVERRVGDIFHKGKLMVFHKPRFDEWGFGVSLEYEAELISRKLVLELLRQAGDAVGLGSFSPTTGCGPHGRFEITQWRDFIV